MATQIFHLVAVIATIALSITPSFLAQQPPTSSPAVSWATRLPSSGGDTVTNLQFYFHDILSGSNPTAVQVASAAGSGSGFGSITMADDPLTETADPKSKLVGRAQGIYASASQSDLALLMSMSYSFVDGPYSGSSLSMLGRNLVMTQGRELPVLGGTGLFRMARGYAVLQTTSANSAGDAVVFYNVTVFAPSSNAENEALPFTPVGGGGGGGRSRGGGANAGGTSPATRVPASGWVGGAVIAAVACFLSM
ncbi:Dirigent protein 23 [Linum perenne]